jgi:hypothetical protein
MTWTLSQSGTTSALSIGSETDLATDTNNGTFVVQVDVSNLANGDLLEIRVYTKTLSGDTLTQSWVGTYQHAQVNNIKISPPVASDISMKATLNQQAGTGRTFKWKFLRV